MEIANEKLLRKKENIIKLSISQGDTKFIKIFRFLYKCYKLNNLSGKAPVIFVFEAIYVKKLNFPAWKLALYCNMSRTTLFNYRNAIVNDFYTCLNENLINEEISITNGEKYE